MHFSGFTISDVWGWNFFLPWNVKSYCRFCIQKVPDLTRLICSTVHIDRSCVSTAVIHYDIFTDIYMHMHNAGDEDVIAVQEMQLRG
jgi:hypothetical protein